MKNFAFDFDLCFFFIWFLFFLHFDGAEEDMAARLSLVVLFFSLKHRNDTESL